MYLSSFIFVRNQTRVQRCLINVKKYYYYFCDIYNVYLFYEKRKRKDICYVKIMLGRGLTDYGKSMALCSMEYWYQWINENKSFIFRILFSGTILNCTLVVNIYISIIFGHRTLVYLLSSESRWILFGVWRVEYY